MLSFILIYEHHSHKRAMTNVGDAVNDEGGYDDDVDSYDSGDNDNEDDDDDD